MVARRQLLDAGVTAKTIGGRVRDGHLLRLHRGVYAVGHARLRREGHWLAAVLATGPRAVLGHRDAAGLHGLRPANHARVEVTTTGNPRRLPGIRPYRTGSLDAQDITTVQGIPVTTVARTIADLAYVVPHDHLTRAIKEAELRNAFDLAQVEAAMARTAGRRGPGHRALREALEERRAFEATTTLSPLEDAFLRRLRKASLPLPQTNVLVEGFKVDAVWQASKVVVELDGWSSHHTRHAFEEDRERDAALTAAGYRVIRLTHRQLTRRPDRAIETLRRLGV